MSRIFGSTDYFAVAEKDPFLSKALTKLIAQLRSVTDKGCVLVGRTGTAPARFMVGGDHDLSRRWSWRIFCGPIPAGHRIYTTCGEQDCVYPYHLMAYRHDPPPRTPRRIVRPRAKLTWPQVSELRSLKDLTVAELAHRYAVHPSTVRAILAEKTWVEK